MSGDAVGFHVIDLLEEGGMGWRCCCSRAFLEILFPIRGKEMNVIANIRKTQKRPSTGYFQSQEHDPAAGAWEKPPLPSLTASCGY
jgi:hypothetical protein